MATQTHLDSHKALTSSYADYGEYPTNLLRGSEHDQILLKRYRDQLREYEDRLFEDPNLLKIPVRDINDKGGVNKRNVTNEEVLEKWLGAAQLLEQRRNPNVEICLPEDPNCRFISLVTPSLGRPLELTKKALLQILSYHQVMPSFLDFLFAYGSLNPHREARSSGFRVESSLSGSRTSVIDQFGRSDKRYQISYSIKSLSRYAVSHNWDDIIRQVAIHHQFDARTGKQLWIFGDPHADLKKAIGTRFPEQHQHAVFNGVHTSFQSSLVITMLVLNSTLREWRMVFQVFDAKVDDLMFQDTLKPNMDMVQDVQWRILGLDEAIVVLESNEAIMTSLGKFYSDSSQELPSTVKPGAAPWELNADQVKMDEIKEALRSFMYDLNNHIREAQLQRQHLMVLQKMLTERKSMLLDRLQALVSEVQIEAADRQENLSRKQLDLSLKQETLSEVQEELSRSMWEYARRSAQETVAMRIIAVVTLIYLPPTFVSTFFSTDIVKYQSGESYSSLALQRWWAVTGPLMGLTLGVAGVWFFFHINQENKEMEDLRNRNPGVYSWKIRMK